MGCKLICPKCKESNLTWITEGWEEKDLDECVMKCNKCGAELLGISGWRKAWGLPSVEEVLEKQHGCRK